MVKHILVLCGEEDVFIDKETINCQFNTCWSFMSALGTLTILCNTCLQFLLTPHIIPFHLENRLPQITSPALTPSVVTSDPRTPPTLTIFFRCNYCFSYLLIVGHAAVWFPSMDSSCSSGRLSNCQAKHEE